MIFYTSSQMWTFYYTFILTIVLKIPSKFKYQSHSRPHRMALPSSNHFSSKKSINYPPTTHSFRNRKHIQHHKRRVLPLIPFPVPSKVQIANNNASRIEIRDRPVQTIKRYVTAEDVKEVDGGVKFLDLTRIVVLRSGLESVQSELHLENIKDEDIVSIERSFKNPWYSFQITVGNPCKR